MNKKLFVTLCAMSLLTALLAFVLIGCRSNTDPGSNTSGQSAAGESTDEFGTVIVPIGTTDENGNQETLVIGAGAEPTRDVDDSNGQNTQKTPTGTTSDTPAGTTSGDPDTPGTGTDTPGSSDTSADGPNLELTYEEYLNMTGDQQTAHYNSFGEGVEGMMAFIAWFDSAKAEYQEQNQGIEATGDGSLDLGDYVNQQP